MRSPTLIKCKNPFENNCILNFIRINNLDRLHFNKINSGGFSSIHITEIEYWYVFSGSESEIISLMPDSTFSPENMMRKTVIVKREENQSEESRNRILHEKKILKKIKNGNALFIPKYYVPFNETAEVMTLFCDYIASPNLSEYSLLHRLSLSPSSKVLILLMLSQGIRFLSGYQVLHLDLKPQNIMITKSMMVKIIDFG
jgi:serine/threonine protein kinase